MTTGEHWLTRPATIRGLWVGFGVVLALTLAAEAFIHRHAWAGIDGWFGFSAAFGFIACVAMIVIARLLGVLLKRPDTYYER